MPNWDPSPSTPERRRVMWRGDHQHLVDAGEDQRGQRVVDHRLVVDRDELLADAQRHRMQPRARAAGQDDASHEALSMPGRDHIPGDRRCRLHRLELRALRPRHTDATVTVLDKLTYAGNSASREPCRAIGSHFVLGDICDWDLVDRLVAGHDAVVHFAAESHNDNSLRDPSPFVTTNLVGTYTLLEAVRRTGLATTTSPPTRCTATWSSTIRGGSPRPPLQPVEPVLVDQGRSDLLVRAWVRSFGVQATISNCSNNYGPISTSRSSFLARSPTCSTAAAPSSTGPGSTSGTGSTPTTTAPRCC